MDEINAAKLTELEKAQQAAAAAQQKEQRSRRRRNRPTPRTCVYGSRSPTAFPRRGSIDCTVRPSTNSPPI
ncbi:hypothetical protein GS416_03960, partial [Rhodococcus hoagii]|nr:hypothetical protein [Prescottella equi]